ncbi:FtsX-like permease family protein [Paenibacillus sp. LHD-117]|uniref:ABC transporter permease n=1 Tax=Paenibacillus sp. LHD-117 TaxID=3071412 RepID=UPI0027E129D6|nr:FtsX-like permease family protein [Paenibacillus sp. LHD-117]MDQ6418828.1 FtsX-like permease family protein [Paenibacillus sp. LHD-117]
MKFSDQLRFVRQNMKRNKTRLFMTVLATAMGCAFLTVLASVGFGLQQSVVEEVVGDRLVTEITIFDKNPDLFDTQGIQNGDIDYFQSLPNVKAVTYRNYVQQWLEPNVDNVPVEVNQKIGMDFEAEKRAGFALGAGRLPEQPNEIVVGYHIREQMPKEGETSPPLPDASEWLDKTMKLQVSYYENGALAKKTIDAVIVGVAAKPTREWNLDKNLYFGEGLLEQIEAITGTQLGELPYFETTPTEEQVTEALANIAKPSAERNYQDVTVIAEDASKVKQVAEAIREKGYYNHSIADELKQVNMIFMIMKIGLIFIGTIAVLIASIGIFNTMTMAVTERAQDIGIMKAIGAHPSVIRRVFLLESSLIGLFGAIIGTVVSYGISIAVNGGLPFLIQMLMEEELPADFKFSIIPPFLAVLTCVIALGVALVSGQRPARRATRIDVLSALRREV